jgi:hypothetical protein
MQYFPMKDGPWLPIELAEQVFKGYIRLYGEGRTIGSMAATGGFSYAQVSTIFTLLRKRDKSLYNEIIRASRGNVITVLDDAEHQAQKPFIVPSAPSEVIASEPLTIVCWKWRSKNMRTQYTNEHVNILAGMINRHYNRPYRLVCYTDEMKGLDKGIEVHPIWNDHANIPNPSGQHLPSCYRRLKIFSDQVSNVLGKRIVSIDLDVLICGDMSPVWDRSDGFIGWKVPSPAHGHSFNGSMWLFRSDAGLDFLWTKFDPRKSPNVVRSAIYHGSDQGWISMNLHNAAGWNAHDGVYSYPREIKALGKLPHNARIIIFHGGRKPWEKVLWSQHPWIPKFYRR